MHTEDLKKLKHLEETYIPCQTDALQSNIVKVRDEATQQKERTKFTEIPILENDIADNMLWFQMREVEARKDEIEKLEKKKKRTRATKAKNRRNTETITRTTNTMISKLFVHEKNFNTRKDKVFERAFSQFNGTN